MKVKVAISNRHVHLTKETYIKLFENDNIKVKYFLNQIGEFASLSLVNLEYNGKIIENVRIVGPFRRYNQVELLKSDFEYLGIKEIARKSGDLDNTPGITIVNDNNKVTIDKGVIRAQRHIHINSKDQDKLNLHDDDEVMVISAKEKFNAFVKASDNGYYEMHIDKDEALEYGLNMNDEVEFIKI